MKSKIAHWLNTWKHPVTAAARENLEAVSKAAADKLGAANSPQAYTLFPTNRDVRIRPHGTISPALRLAGLIYGRPVTARLWQKHATGLLGPFARARKAARKEKVSKENALVFWKEPADGIGKVLKAGIGKAGHAREIRMLRMLGGLDGMVPALLAYDPALRWMVMEQVESVSALTAHEQAECYIRQIAPRYFAFWGCRAKPVWRYPGGKPAPSRLEDEARHLGLFLPEGWQDGLLDWSITHGGGICEEILVRAEGGVCLLDWEKAALAPIAEDLLQAFEYRPQETLALFETLKSSGTMAAAGQLTVALCERSIQNRARKNPITARLRSDRLCATHLAALGAKTAQQPQSDSDFEQFGKT